MFTAKLLKSSSRVTKIAMTKPGMSLPSDAETTSCAAIAIHGTAPMTQP
jgi:hypothetical protein